MEQKWLMILEVSQKQTYIFRSRKLKNNIIASDMISYVTSTAFFLERAGLLYKEEENLVYAGGGHTILEFKTKEQAQAFAKTITMYIMKEIDELEIFVKIVPYDYGIDGKPSQVPGKNIAKLLKALEEKKSLRTTAFRQGMLGIEQQNKDDRDQIRKEESRIVQERGDMLLGESEKSIIAPYELEDELSKLGGSKDESNFIAVIHIDGNLMGKRVQELEADLAQRLEDLQEEEMWDRYKDERKKFSQQIDEDFQAAYQQLICTVREQLEGGNLNALSIEDGSKKSFPIRRVIMAGDDVCLVTEGRIGLECAATFLRNLMRIENKVDEKNYSACAGVAIVHHKYPFHKAYELAEELCRRAKKKIAEKGEADGTSAIDWHIEFGQLEGTMEEINQHYVAADKEIVTAKPYLVAMEGSAGLEGMPTYDRIREILIGFQREDGIARRNVKDIRPVLKDSCEALKLYLVKHPMGTLLNTEIEPLQRRLLFDAIELMDTYAPFLRKDEI